MGRSEREKGWERVQGAISPVSRPSEALAEGIQDAVSGRGRTLYQIRSFGVEEIDRADGAQECQGGRQEDNIGGSGMISLVFDLFWVVHDGWDENKRQRTPFRAQHCSERADRKTTSDAEEYVKNKAFHEESIEKRPSWRGLVRTCNEL